MKRGSIKNLVGLSRGFLVDNRGTTAIEYGIIASLISIIIIGAVASIGEATSNNVFTAIAGFLD